MKELTAGQVEIHDLFWSTLLAVNSEKAIFHQNGESITSWTSARDKQRMVDIDNAPCLQG